MAAADDALEFERRAQLAEDAGRGDAARVLRLAAADMRTIAARAYAAQQDDA